VGGHKPRVGHPDTTAAATACPSGTGAHSAAARGVRPAPAVGVRLIAAGATVVVHASARLFIGLEQWALIGPDSLSDP